jgi:ethanolamine ammonia-lyase small subunit
MAEPDSRGGAELRPDRPPAGRDPWHALAAHTPARIALGRAGGSLRTQSLLDLRVAHARARDAVRAPFDAAALGGAFRGRGLESVTLATAAGDRGLYLARPDLGRELGAASAGRLRALSSSWGQRDLAILVSDGLSARAAEAHAVPSACELARILAGCGWTLYPIFIVPFARVKLQDQVGSLVGARFSVILLGERPGLSAHDSLGAYLTFGPNAARTDADRNCVSNIRDDGLPPGESARRIADLLIESRRLGLSGTALRLAQGPPGPAGGIPA